MEQEYDVLIVGGGLAGQCLALALAKSSLNIVLVEAQSHAEQQASPAGERALALSSGTVSMLETLGVWSLAYPDATAIKHIHISDQGHFGKTRLSAAKEKLDALGYVISARDLEKITYDLMTNNTGIRVISPARIVGIASEQHAAHVSLKQGANSRTLSAKLVVGADGGQSTIRKLLNIQQTISTYQQSAIVTTIKTELAHQHIAYERFTASGPLALLPAKEDYSVVWTRKTDEAQNLISDCESDFIAQLHACFGYKLGAFTLCSPRRLFPLQLIRAKTMYSGRAVIIGNAAHQLHPVAGQGFNLGLRDVIQLAKQLITAHEQQQDIGAENLLKNYVQQRIKDHNQVIRFTDNTVKLFSNKHRSIAVARNTGLLLLDIIPSAKHYFAQSAMGLQK